MNSAVVVLFIAAAGAAGFAYWYYKWPRVTATFSNDYIHLIANNFAPNSEITVTILQSHLFTTDSSGDYIGDLYCLSGPGQYSLTVTDDFGHIASTTFTIPN